MVDGVKGTEGRALGVPKAGPGIPCGWNPILRINFPIWVKLSCSSPARSSGLPPPAGMSPENTLFPQERARPGHGSPPPRRPPPSGLAARKAPQSVTRVHVHLHSEVWLL